LTGGSIDTSSWYIEKAGNVVAFLSFVFRRVATRQPLDQEAIDEILGILGAAAYDATKLLADAAGSLNEWRTDDCDLVTSGKRDDVELLHARYGLAVSPETKRRYEAEQLSKDRAREHAALSELLATLIDFVYPGAPNERAAVRSAVDACLVDLSAIRLLRGLLEAQAQNELSWPNFVELAQQHIESIVRRRDALAVPPGSVAGADSQG
jgi:hypothetical protein